MNKLLRMSCLGLVGLTAVACGAMACSSTTNTAGNAADGGIGADPDGTADGSASADGTSAVDGGTTTGPRGTILVTQTHLGTSFHYSIAAAFRGFVAPTGSGSAPAQTTMGACTALVIPTAAGDASTPAAVAGLNAGTLTITGSGTPASTALVYGPVASQQGVPGYTAAGGMTALFAAGDTLTVAGAGGPDLPAFAAQSVVAPTQVALTAPACAGTCPDLDRTKDLTVAWTGAGAGKVVVTFETIADAQAVLVQCKFDATTGSGVVPAALLAKLDKAGDPNVSGIESISDENELDFTVGSAPTTFTVQQTNVESQLTVSN